MLEKQIELLSNRFEGELSSERICHLNEELRKTAELLINITSSHPRAGVEKPEET